MDVIDSVSRCLNREVTIQNGAFIFHRQRLVSHVLLDLCPEFRS